MFPNFSPCTKKSNTTCPHKAKQVVTEAVSCRHQASYSHFLATNHSRAVAHHPVWLPHIKEPLPESMLPLVMRSTCPSSPAWGCYPAIARQGIPDVNTFTAPCLVWTIRKMVNIRFMWGEWQLNNLAFI